MITNEMMQPWSMELETEENKSPNGNKRPMVGVGVNDMVGSARYIDGKQKKHPCYDSWKGILVRTYCPKRHAVKPQRYADVVEEWRTLSGFYSWWLTQPYYEDGNIDSDLLAAANDLPKAYTPETAVFVPGHINRLLNVRERHRGELPQGVSLHRKKYRAQMGRGASRWQAPVTADLAEALSFYWDKKLKYSLETAWDLLEEHPQRDVLMLGIKITLRNQHEESYRRLNEVLECQQMKAQQ